MQEVKFVVLGEPQGKGRPRFMTRYNSETKKSFGKARTPEKTIVYENLIKMEYNQQCNGFRFSDDAMLDMQIKAFYSIAQSKSKKMKEAMRSHEIRPTKKPDADNVIKVVADSLNQVAYRDDAQIVDTMFKKFFSDRPRIEVRIRSVGGENQSESVLENT